MIKSNLQHDVRRLTTANNMRKEVLGACAIDDSLLLLESEEFVTQTLTWAAKKGSGCDSVRIATLAGSSTTLCLLSAFDFRTYCTTKSNYKKPPNLLEAQKMFLRMTQDELNNMVKHIQFFSTILQVGEAIYIPAGYFVCEKHTGAMSRGCRFTVCLDKCSNRCRFAVGDLARLFDSINADGKETVRIMRAARDAVLVGDFLETHKQTCDDHGVAQQVAMKKAPSQPSSWTVRVPRQQATVERSRLQHNPNKNKRWSTQWWRWRQVRRLLLQLQFRTNVRRWKCKLWAPRFARKEHRRRRSVMTKTRA